MSSIHSTQASTPTLFGSSNSSPAPGALKDVPVPKSILEKVLFLIDCQEFGGFWDSAVQGDVFEIMDLPRSTHTALDTLTSNERRLLITMIVVLYLEGKASAEEGIWGLVVGKARSWITSEVGTEEIARLEDKATAFIGEN